MAGPYLNQEGYEVPENKILVVPFSQDNDGYYKEIIEPLKGNPKRHWFDSHFYYCLPLTIGNQYGFIVKSMLDYNLWWDGTENDAEIEFLNSDNLHKQNVETKFRHGIVTIQNHFSLKTPPGINLMTIQPPNMFIPGTFAMTGVIETDQIRRDFTFNFKITVPKTLIGVRKGDAVGAFIPIQRYFVEKFDVELLTDHMGDVVHLNEIQDQATLANERAYVDVDKPHSSGRRYFNGLHADGEKYADHQKRLI